MPQLTDEQRQELCEQMDRDLDDFIEQKKRESDVKRENQAPEEEEDIDALAERLKRHPAFMTEFDPSQPMSPEMEGLMAIKYGSDNTDGNAISFKEDGNLQFKAKKFRWAIDNYTAGLKELSPNKLTNAILYSNRAAANAKIGNYGSAIKDCKRARLFVLNHMKAILKGVACFYQLSKYTEAIQWCDEGLAYDKDNTVLLETRAKAVIQKKQKERDERKAAALERKQQKQSDELLAIIKSRGVTLDGGLSLSELEPTHGHSDARVHLDADGVLHWPVMFLYPEYGETDFISAFNENSNFSDHLYTMFGDEAATAQWDEQQKYKHRDIQLYYEEEITERLIKVNHTSSLKTVLSNKTYKVKGGTPGFIALVKNSPFAESFISKYNT